MSYNYMSAGIASTLLFVYPIMVAVIMTCVYGERLTLSTSLCILMALSGIALLYRATATPPSALPARQWCSAPRSPMPSTSSTSAAPSSTGCPP